MYTIVSKDREHHHLYLDKVWMAEIITDLRSIQQIVTALNAWQEIQQAWERSDNEIEIADNVGNVINKYLDNGVIPKNVHSARERLKESGEKGADNNVFLPCCGEWLFNGGRGR